MYGIKLTYMSGTNDGLEIWLKDHEGKGYAVVDGWQFVIGRREECDLSILFDTQVSREHAYLRVQKGAIWVEDAKSRNGTFVGAQLINAPCQLERKTLFRIGHTWLRLEDFTI